MFEERLGGNESLEEFLKALADLDAQQQEEVEFSKDGKWSLAEEKEAA